MRDVIYSRSQIGQWDKVLKITKKLRFMKIKTNFLPNLIQIIKEEVTLYLLLSTLAFLIEVHDQVNNETHVGISSYDVFHTEWGKWRIALQSAMPRTRRLKKLQVGKAMGYHPIK